MGPGTKRLQEVPESQKTACVCAVEVAIEPDHIEGGCQPGMRGHAPMKSQFHW
jgi:hypothetical protein